MNNATLLLLPGDGIGPEVVVELSRVIEWFGANRDISFEITTDDIGGAAYDRYGTPLADSTLEVAKEVDAIVMGSVSYTHLTLPTICSV